MGVCRQMLDSPLRFEYPDGQIVEFPNWPTCIARVARGNRRCRNEVLDQGNPGPYFYGSDDDPPGMEVELAEDEAKLRAQLCRVHRDRPDVVLFCGHEAIVISGPTVRPLRPE